jgi:hypothetical protein
MPNTFNPHNAQRAMTAFRAVNAHYNFYASPTEAIVDALTDLRHLADEYGIDWHDADRIAADHYGQEVAEATEAAA